jgi:hypothetical protein
VARDQDYRQLGIPAQKRAHQGDAIHVRHADVGDDNAIEFRARLFCGLRGLLKTCDAKARQLERLPGRVADMLLIVDEDHVAAVFSQAPPPCALGRRRRGAAAR